MKKITERGKIKAELKKELLKEDRIFYLKVWKTKPHVCNFCKRYLGLEPATYHFDHILEKQTHPEYRHIDENIQLLCLPCHSNKTNGFVPEWFKEFVKTLKKKLCQDTVTEIPKQEDLLKDLSPL